MLRVVKSPGTFPKKPNLEDEMCALIEACSEAYDIHELDVWGWVEENFKNIPYKKQIAQINNFLRNKLGKGITACPPQS